MACMARSTGPDHRRRALRKERAALYQQAADAGAAFPMLSSQVVCTRRLYAVSVSTRCFEKADHLGHLSFTTPHVRRSTSMGPG